MTSSDDGAIVRRVVARLSNIGRAYRPPAGFDDVESALLEWVARDPGNRERALEWLNYPPPPSVDDQGFPPLPWAKRELELRKPIGAALGIGHKSSGGGFVKVDNYRWLPRPLGRLITQWRVRRRLS